MRVEFYPIERRGPGSLSVMPRPRGGDWLADEMRELCGAGIGVVVSLLTPTDIQQLELDDEAEACERAGMRLIAFPIPDRGLPTVDAEADRLVGEVADLVRNGEHVAIHCRMGIGRTGMISAATLVALGQTPEEAIAAVAAARGYRVPETRAQREWIESYAQRSRPLA